MSGAVSFKDSWKNQLPQKIKIEALSSPEEFHKYRNFCPFQLMRNYLRERGGFETESEHLFVFKYKEIVYQSHVHKVLSELLENLHLDSSLYGFHSFRAGRTVDLAKLQVPLEKNLPDWQMEIQCSIPLFKDIKKFKTYHLV